MPWIGRKPVTWKSPGIFRFDYMCGIFILNVQSAWKKSPLHIVVHECRHPHPRMLRITERNALLAGSTQVSLFLGTWNRCEPFLISGRHARKFELVHVLPLYCLCQLIAIRWDVINSHVHSTWDQGPCTRHRFQWQRCCCRFQKVMFTQRRFRNDDRWHENQDA